MAYFDEPIVDPTLDFDAQDLQLQQQLARIKALRATGAQMPETPTSEVGGWSLSTGQRMPGRVMKTPTAALINPLVANIGADIGEGRAQQMKSDIGKNQQAEMLAALAATPQATPGTPSSELMGPTPDGKPLMSDAIPGQEPTRAQILAHGARLARNPLTRATAQKYVEDQLIGAPTREATQRLELTKAALASRDKALDRDSRLQAARIRAQASGGKLTMIQNDQGIVTGGYDPRTNKTYALGQMPGGSASLDMDGPPVKESDVGGVGGNPAPAATTAPVVQGKKSPAVLKAEETLKGKVEEANDALSMIADARGALKETSYGTRDTLTEGITSIMGGQPSTKQMNAEQLDVIAGNLAAKYPRGPGTITDTERKLFVQYMGNVNNRFLHPSIREANLVKVEKMLRDGVANAQNAQAGGDVNPPTRAAPTVRGEDDPAYTSLKKGDRYTRPDGKTYIKQ